MRPPRHVLHCQLVLSPAMNRRILTIQNPTRRLCRGYHRMMKIKASGDISKVYLHVASDVLVRPWSAQSKRHCLTQSSRQNCKMLARQPYAIGSRRRSGPRVEDLFRRRCRRIMQLMTSRAETLKWASRSSKVLFAEASSPRLLKTSDFWTGFRCQNDF